MSATVRHRWGPLCDLDCGTSTRIHAQPLYAVGRSTGRYSLKTLADWAMDSGNRVRAQQTGSAWTLSPAQRRTTRGGRQHTGRYDSGNRCSTSKFNGPPRALLESGAGGTPAYSLWGLCGDSPSGRRLSCKCSVRLGDGRPGGGRGKVPSAELHQRREERRRPLFKGQLHRCTRILGQGYALFLSVCFSCVHGSQISQ